jgi:penicillin G amidase
MSGTTERPEARGSTLQPDTGYGFDLYLAGQTVSAAGDAFSEVAMPLLVLSLTGSVAQMGFVAGLSTAAQLVGGLFSGWMVDRFDQRRLMAACDIAQLALGAAIPISWWLLPARTWHADALWIIWIVVCASSVLYTNYRVAIRAFLPKLVGRAALTQANSKITMATEIAFGAGPLLAGLGVAVFGAPIAIGINAGSFGFSAVMLMMLRPPGKFSAESSVERTPIAGRLAGLRFVWHNRFLRSLSLLNLANTFLVSATPTLFIFFVRHNLHQSSIVVGLLLTLASVGAVAATLVVTRARKRFGLGPAWLASIGLQGIALAGVSVSTSIWPVGFLAVLFGLGQISAIILGTTRRQEVITEAMMARASAAIITTLLAAQAIGIPAVTDVANATSIRGVFIVVGILVIGVALIGTRTVVRADRSRPSGQALPPRRPWPRPVRLGLALLVSGAVIAVCGIGLGSAIPPLGPVFNPGTGVWHGAASAEMPARTQTLRLAGLHSTVKVEFNQAGVPTIVAPTAAAAFLAQGYITARYRLFQMDLLRREAGGELSAILGPGALSSDETELALGLDRTANAEYRSLAASDPARQALDAYAAGVNEALSAMTRDRELPAAIQLLRYTPAAWSGVDSLLVQGDLTQTLDFTTTPIDDSLLARSLGADREQAWFAVTASSPNVPYDPGPYHSAALAPIGARIPGTSPTRAVSRVPQARPAENQLASSSRAPGGHASSAAAAAAADWLAALPAQVHQYAESNNWAVAPSRSATGTTMLASDPHLQQTLPSIWYQVVIDAPGLQVSGVAVPGVPGVLIGRTPDLAWGLTDTQNQSTLFYTEIVSRANPDYYFWRGGWHAFRLYHYSIAVKGQSPAGYTVRVGVDGPMFTAFGQTAAVWWAGALPSDDLGALLRLYRASSGAQVRAALAGWLAPTETFAYATASGQIGLYAPGVYPQVSSGRPWLPLRGTGGDDVAGTIPPALVPQVSDPADGIVFSANERPVSPSYPYYIGTVTAFDGGFRALEIKDFLASHQVITMEQMQQLQADLHDRFAVELRPYLLRALRSSSGSLTRTEKAAAATLADWNCVMSATSPGASIWWTFLTDYLSATFGPWWQARAVPTRTDPDLDIGPGQVSLDLDLLRWTTSDPANQAFTLPDGTARTAPQVIVLAFARAISQLSARFGATPSLWAWDRLHSTEFASLSGVTAASYGPRGSGGDLFTPDAADGFPVSTSGPSWRMVVSFSGGSVGNYPGGQSENPTSPWYESFIASWWHDRYRPLPPPGGVEARADPTWTLEP